MTTIRIARGALLLAALATAACKGKQQEAAPPAESPNVTAPPPAAPPPANPGAAIETGRAIDQNKRVLAALDQFGRRDTIYASVSTQNAPPNTVLVATWTHESGQTVKVDTQAVATPNTAVEFHITKRTPWPTGSYKVAVTMNGEAVADKEFSVR